jgi:hypothetical protein
MGGYLRALKIVFGIIVAISVLAVASGVMEVMLLNQMIAGEEVTDSQVNVNDARQAIVAVLQMLALVAGAITFILWLYRAYQNTDKVAPGVRRHGLGWAIGGWFVPILAAWRPKEIINDVWRAGGGPTGPPPLLAVWWGFWLLSNFVSNIVARIGLNGDTTEDIRNGSLAYVFSDALDVVAAILAIVVAVKLTERLDERAKQGPPQPHQPHQPRFERDEEQEAVGAFPTRGDVAVPPRFGSGEPYR